jgi:hypothetical protein
MQLALRPAQVLDQVLDVLPLPVPLPFAQAQDLAAVIAVLGLDRLGRVPHLIAAQRAVNHQRVIASRREHAALVQLFRSIFVLKGTSPAYTTPLQ